ncbi:YceI family protein [Larkinella soli]|uniref:YceI family protein n=1 Tax=Larkinella soli TaxID=1770527 RepID=UPI000FFB6274|nr:YceI family protein [Larkinella soli]
METSAPATTTTVWTIDPSHSEILFKVRHLMVSNVTGRFGTFDGKLETAGENFESAKASFWADIDSISTGTDQRDAHLKSPDFFDAANHPKLTFESTAIRKTGEDTFEMTGNLTIRETTKQVTLKVEHGGTMTDPWGNTKAGFEITGSIKRKEYGLTWDVVTEAGGVVAGDEVKLVLNVQVVKQQG